MTPDKTEALSKHVTGSYGDQHGPRSHFPLHATGGSGQRNQNFRDCPVTGHAANVPKSARMTHSRHRQRIVIASSPINSLATRRSGGRGGRFGIKDPAQISKLVLKELGNLEP